MSSQSYTAPVRLSIRVGDARHRALLYHVASSLFFSSVLDTSHTGLIYSQVKAGRLDLPSQSRLRAHVFRSSHESQATLQTSDTNAVRDKIRGSILGGAIGDAMGGPLEGRPEGFAEAHYGGPVAELHPYLDRETFKPIPGRAAGEYTDDTRLKNILCTAMIDLGGRVTAEEFAEVWLRDMDPEFFYLSEKIAFYKLRFKRTIAREGGAGNVPACDADMMISPVGLINACNPRQAGLDAFEVASVFQSGYSATSACAIAAAVAQAMEPDAGLDQIIDAAIANTDRLTAPAIQRSVELARAASDFSAFKKSFYDELLIIPVDAIEVTSAVFGIIVAVDGDLRQGVIQAANFGRDCDTIAGIVGSILGALHGASPLKQSWIDGVNKANPNPDLEQISYGIFGALCNEIRKQIEYVEKLRWLLW